MVSIAAYLVWYCDNLKLITINLDLEPKGSILHVSSQHKINQLSIDSTFHSIRRDKVLN